MIVIVVIYTDNFIETCNVNAVSERTIVFLPYMDFLSDRSRMSNSLWIRSSMAAFTGSQLTVTQSTFSWLTEEEEKH